MTQPISEMTSEDLCRLANNARQHTIAQLHKMGLLTKQQETLALRTTVAIAFRKGIFGRAWDACFAPNDSNLVIIIKIVTVVDNLPLEEQK